MKTAILLCIAASLLQAAEACRACHAPQVEHYQKSPMGNAISLAATLSPASFVHALSQTTIRIFNRANQSHHRLERDGISAEYPLAYRIGSGHHAAGFLVRVGSALFQSPAAYYQRTSRWDVAPGYEQMPRLDFNRRITEECLACHSSGEQDSLQPISCEQCHGPSRDHLRKPSRVNIINPARLPVAERDAVCEKCHLNGEARIKHPETAKDAYSVVVYDRPRSDLRVVSHVEQLALSACVRAGGGKLWCGSCHQPHGESINVNAQCRSCHEGKLPASHQNRQECVSCHMPKRDAVDGGHSAFTDHRIQRDRSSADVTPSTTASSPRLRLWREVNDSALRERNLGLASILVGERDASPALINDGYRRLAAVFPRWQRDADVLSAMGMVLFLKDQKADALKLLQAAITERPGDPLLHEKMALVQRATGNLPGAIQNLEHAIRLDPSRESPYYFLAECQPSREAKQVTLERFLRIIPQSLIAREALQRLKQLPRP